MKKLFQFFFTGIILLSSCNSKDNTTETSVSKTTSFDQAPEWAKEVVWYQIFVERFRNGDPDNDPTPVDIEGTYPGFIPANWKITPWTQEWYQEDDYFDDLNGKTDFLGNDINTFNQKLGLRRYGGDLQGVFDKLDYLKELGVTAIYFNPLNDAPSLHKYDARHWRHIDRNFGPDPQKDVATMALETPDDPGTWQMTEADKMFVRLIDELHQRNIKVILDYSWNHTGHTSWAWQDVLKNQQASAYADWYWVKQFDNPETPENEFEYQGWLGVFDLPEIKETQAMNHHIKVEPFEGNIFNEAAKQHIFNVTQRWLDPNGDNDPSDGVDGFRLDVAAEMPLGFWRDYRKFVREINPDAYLIGEIWWEQFPDKLLDPKPYLEGDIFDAVMNYRWYRAARHFFASAPSEIPVSEFVDSLKSFSSNLRKGNNYAMMNVAATHDSPRLLTSLFNKNKYKFNASPAPERDYKIYQPDEATYQNLYMLLVQQFTYFGAPHIWAGDEMGMWGSDDPENRKPLIWQDYNFEPETLHPYGQQRPVDEVKFDEQHFKVYQKLIQIRQENPVLAHGDIDYLIIDDNNKLLAYSRFDEKEEVIAIFNASEKNQILKVEAKTNTQFREVFQGLEILQNKKEVELEMPSRSAAILVGQ
ncbi:MAG: glycoside hydrolase family 13 protein [Cyclobacteriaceae bacterium]